MAKRKREMYITNPEEVEDDGEEILSRSKQRAIRKDFQGRLDALTERLKNLAPPVVAEFDLGEQLEDELRVLRLQKKGSALARQRKRVAGLLRRLDLDALEKQVSLHDER